MRKVTLYIIFILLTITTTFALNTKQSYAQDLYHFLMEHTNRSEICENQLPDKIEFKLYINKDKNHNSGFFIQTETTDINEIREIIDILKNTKCTYNNIANEIKGNEIVITCHYDELILSSYNQVRTTKDAYAVFNIQLSSEGNYLLEPAGKSFNTILADIDNTVNTLAKYFDDERVNNNLIYDPLETSKNFKENITEELEMPKTNIITENNTESNIDPKGNIKKSLDTNTSTNDNIDVAEQDTNISILTNNLANLKNFNNRNFLLILVIIILFVTLIVLILLHKQK